MFYCQSRFGYCELHRPLLTVRVTILLVFAAICGPLTGLAEDAGAAREAAVAASAMIAEGKQPPALTDDAQIFLDAFVASKMILQEPKGDGVQWRQLRFIGTRSANFSQAYSNYVTTGAGDPVIALTGVQWAWFLLTGSLDQKFDGSVPQGSGQELRLRRLHDRLGKMEPPAAALRGLLWGLATTPPERVRYDGETILNNAALAASQYAKQLPPIDAKTKLADLRDNPQLLGCLDTEELTRALELAMQDDRYQPQRSRWLLLWLAASLANGATAEATTERCMDALVKCADHSTAWEGAVLLLGQASDLADHPQHADHTRRARGLLLAAYCKSRDLLARSKSSLIETLRTQLEKYVSSCEAEHPYTGEWPIMPNRGQAQPDVLRACLALAGDQQFNPLDLPNNGLRQRTFLLAAAFWASAPDAPGGKTDFAAWLPYFRAAVERDAALRGKFIDLAAWRPEFWDPKTWDTETGPFKEWKALCAHDGIKSFVECARRLSGLLVGVADGGDHFAPAQGEILPRFAETEKTIRGLEARDQRLGSLLRHAIAVLHPNDLWLVTAGDQGKTDDLKLDKVADLEDAATQLLNSFAVQVRTPDEAAAIFARVDRRYQQFAAAGPCKDSPCQDNRPFYELGSPGAPTWNAGLAERLGSLLHLPPLSDTEDKWRHSAASALVWLTVAKAHERLGERDYYRAGFIFDRNHDYQSARVIQHVRNARRHLLHAQSIYRWLCPEFEKAEDPYRDSSDKTVQRAVRIRPTPLQRFLLVETKRVEKEVVHWPLSTGTVAPFAMNQRSVSAMEEAVLGGLDRTKGLLDQLDAGLDCTGHSGSIGLVRDWNGFLTRLEILGKMVRQGAVLDLDEVSKVLNVQAARQASSAADARVAARAERLAAAQLELQLAKLSVTRSQWLLDAAKMDKLSTHFAAGAADEFRHAALFLADAQKIKTIGVDYERQIVQAQIDMLLAVLPQYVVELQYAEALSGETSQLLADQAKRIDDLRAKFKEGQSKDILGAIISVVRVVVDVVCTAYGLPPLGSITMSAVQSIEAFAEGRTQEGLAFAVDAFEKGGGKKLLEEGARALGDEINTWGFVKDLKNSDSGNWSLIRTFGSSVLPEQFTDLLNLSAEEAATGFLAVVRDPQAAQQDAETAIAQFKKNAGDEKYWGQVLRGQALQARKRLQQGAVRLGINEAGRLLSDKNHGAFTKFLADRLGVEAPPENDAVVSETLAAIRQDALAGVKTALTHVYQPLGNLRTNIVDRSAKSRDNLYKATGFPEDQLTANVERWVNEWKETGEIPQELRAAGNAAKNELGRKLISWEVLDAIFNGRPLPESVKDLSWLESLAEDLIDGSLDPQSVERLAALKAQGADGKDDFEKESRSLTAALAGLRAATDQAIAREVVKRFSLTEEGADVRVCAAWDTELRTLYGQAYSGDGQGDQDDLERYWRTIQDEFDRHELPKVVKELLKSPPPASLPPEIQAQLDEVDRALQEAVGACQWLLNSQNYQANIDGIVKQEDDNAFQNEKVRLLERLHTELDKAVAALKKASPAVGLPKQPLDPALKDACTRMAKLKSEEIALQVQQIEIESEIQRLTKDIDAYDPNPPPLVANAVANLKQQRTGKEADLATKKDEIERKAKEFNQARDAAYARMKGWFDLIERNANLPTGDNLTDEQRAQLAAHAERVHKQVEDMLNKLSNPTGLFSTVAKYYREKFALDLQHHQERLTAVAKNHEALAAGMVAAQRKADSQASQFRLKAAEVDLAMTKKYVKISQAYVRENENWLRAEQYEFQRSRTHYDLAQVDAARFDRLNRNADDFYTPEFQRLLQRSIWRTARDAVLFARVYLAIEEPFETPEDGYWSPAAVEGLRAKLDGYAQRPVYNRQQTVQNLTVFGALTIDRHVLHQHGHDALAGGNSPVWRVRCTLRSQRYPREDGQAYYPPSPYPHSQSWRVEESDILDRVLLANKLGLQNSTDADLAAALNQKLFKDLPVQGPPGGKLVRERRLALENDFPGLLRATSKHHPLFVDVHEGFQFERSAVHQVLVFLNTSRPGDRNSALATVRCRHLGHDAWLTHAKLTHANANEGIALPWEPASFAELHAKPWRREARDFPLADRPECRELVREWLGDADYQELTTKHFSLFYPMLGTYEIDLPRDPRLKDGSAELYIIFCGYGIQRAGE